MLMSRWKYYNPNPRGLRVGDCTVRAICKALNIDWEYAFVGMYVQACIMSNMPSANCVWGRFLTKNGFKMYQINNHGLDQYTLTDFCMDNPTGTYIVCFNGHVVCVEDGHYYDSWDSGNQIPLYYYTR